MNFKNSENLHDSDREDEDGIDQSLNLGKNNEDFSSIFNIDQQIEDTDRLPIYKNNDFPSIFNRDHQIEDIDILQNCKNNDDFTSFDIRFKHLQYIENMNDDPMISVRYMSEDKEIKEENEQNPNDKALDEINTLENKVTSNKTTNKINIIEKINPSFGPENEFICKKRKESFSIDNSNEKNKENSPNKKESIKPYFKVIKQKEKNPQANNSSLQLEIKSFHTLFNTYFKYLVEEGNSFNVSVFDKKVGPNGYYISSDFTQLNLKVEKNSLKLNEKISKYIKKEKLEKIKKKKLSLDVLSLTCRELIYMFYGYIFENKEYFEKNETIKKLNNKFLRIRKYPLIGFKNGKSDEKYKFGYFKYYD